MKDVFAVGGSYVAGADTPNIWQFRVPDGKIFKFLRFVAEQSTGSDVYPQFHVRLPGEAEILPYLIGIASTNAVNTEINWLLPSGTELRVVGGSIATGETISFMVLGVLMDKEDL